LPADAPAEAARTASLSPSRAADFMTCPLLYRFRVIDRLPERPSRAASRGTLVHAVLERLFDLPAEQRTHARATQALEPTWERLVAAEPMLASLLDDENPAATGGELGPPVPAQPVPADEGEAALPSSEQLDAFLAEAESLLARYFTLEDPTRLEPAEREVKVSLMLDSGLELRGIVDRLDVAPTGEVRVVDYKTGRAPSEAFEAKALFQMKFYALVLWRLRGRVPTLLQLIYLGGGGDLIRYQPDEADLLATERKVKALWRAIDRAQTTGDWRPHPSRLCDWCDYKAFCPAFGGTPPPLPPAAIAEQA